MLVNLGIRIFTVLFFIYCMFNNFEKPLDKQFKVCIYKCTCVCVCVCVCV